MFCLWSTKYSLTAEPQEGTDISINQWDMTGHPLYQNLIVVTTNISMWKHTAEQMLSSTFSSHSPTAAAPFVSVFTKWGEKQDPARVRMEWTGCSFWLILSIIVKGSTEIAGSTVIVSKIRRDHYSYLVWHFAQHRPSDFFEIIPAYVVASLRKAPKNPDF